MEEEWNPALTKSFCVAAFTKQPNEIDIWRCESGRKTKVRTVVLPIVALEYAHFQTDFRRLYIHEKTRFFVYDFHTNEIIDVWRRNWNFGQRLSVEHPISRNGFAFSMRHVETGHTSACVYNADNTLRYELEGHTSSISDLRETKEDVFLTWSVWDETVRTWRGTVLESTICYNTNVVPVHTQNYFAFVAKTKNVCIFHFAPRCRTRQRLPEDQSIVAFDRIDLPRMKPMGAHRLLVHDDRSEISIWDVQKCTSLWRRSIFLTTRSMKIVMLDDDTIAMCESWADGHPSFKLSVLWNFDNGKPSEVYQVFHRVSMPNMPTFMGPLDVNQILLYFWKRSYEIWKYDKMEGGRLFCERVLELPFETQRFCAPLGPTKIWNGYVALWHSDNKLEVVLLPSKVKMIINRYDAELHPAHLCDVVYIHADTFPDYYWCSFDHSLYAFDSRSIAFYDKIDHAEFANVLYTFFEDYFPHDICSLLSLFW